MRGLSIVRPWIWTYIHADNAVLNWPEEITYRGDVAFRASKRWDDAACPVIARKLMDGGWVIPSFVKTMHPQDVLQFVGTIVDCMTFDALCEQTEAYSVNGNPAAPFWKRQCAWAQGPWCVIIDNVRELKPSIPHKGALGFFNVSEEVRASL